MFPCGLLGPVGILLPLVHQVLRRLQTVKFGIFGQCIHLLVLKSEDHDGCHD